MDLTAEGVARTAAVTQGLLPESLHVRSAALRLHCLVWGRPHDPVAVLIHGNGGHAHWWDALVPALVPGWRLIVPDLRGHGESDWPEPASYRIEDFCADLVALLDAVGPHGQPLALVGHSMGGRVAAWCAAHYPQRVRALGLLDTRLCAMNHKLAAKYRGRIVGTRHGRGYATRAAALAAFRFVPDESGVAAEVLADLAHHAIHERGPADWTFRFDRAVLALDGDGGGELYGLIERIQCPTVILHGESSWVMDAAECAAISAAISNCVTRTFPGGHHFLIAHPRPVGDALRAFLDRVQSGTWSDESQPI